MADYIRKRIEEKKEKSYALPDSPLNTLANEFNRIIDQEWEGKASELIELLSSDAGVSSARELGVILSKTAREGGIPGWRITDIRIGETRQKGYRISRV